MSRDCQELRTAYQKVYGSSLPEDRKWLEAATLIVARSHPGVSGPYYKWMVQDNITFYRSYDSISKRIFPHREGKRKLPKTLHVTGLPDHCWEGVE